jgi:hypothetical protein
MLENEGKSYLGADLCNWMSTLISKHLLELLTEHQSFTGVVEWESIALVPDIAGTLSPAR